MMYVHRFILPVVLIVYVACGACRGDSDDAGKQNLLTDGGFEGEYKGADYPATARTSSAGWMILPRDNAPPRYWGLTTEHAVEGKRCMKLTDQAGEQRWHLRVMPRMLSSDFKGPYLLSCRIRTEGEHNPSIVPVWFGIDARSEGAGRRFTIATVGANTEWTQYSGIVSRDDMRFAPGTEYKWSVSIQVRRGFKGSVWVDDVKLIPIDAPALTFTLDANEQFVTQSSVVVRGSLNPEQLLPSGAALLVHVKDATGQQVHVETKSVTSRDFTFPIDVGELPEGAYTVVIYVKDKHGNTVSHDQPLSRIADPLDF